jgi:ribose transport system ATP-binding protein
MQPNNAKSLGGSLMGNTVVRIENLTKTFPGTVALRDLSFTLNKGEVHALLGHNGSGKSTLIKILSGYHKPDAGARLWVLDRQRDWEDTRKELRANLHFIHQDLGLIPELTVIENFGLLRRLGTIKRPLQRHRLERDYAQEAIERIGFSLDVSKRISHLTPGERCAVAVARALSGLEDTHLLCLDEPTAYLEKPEVEKLFHVMRQVAASGVSVVFVSHNLGEVLEVADKVTVLRDGREVITAPIEELSEQKLASLIAGAEPEKKINVNRIEPHVEPDQSELLRRQDRYALRVENLSGGRIKRAEFAVSRGEILGVAGLAGSGREDLASLLFGMMPRASGRVELAGTAVGKLTPSHAVRLGIALVPRDRGGLGLHMNLNLAENVSLSHLGRLTALRKLLAQIVGGRRERRKIARWLKEGGVSPAQPELFPPQLSGGNQQKLLLTKWISLLPRLLILDEPTQGVDVGARAAIHKRIRSLADERCPVIVVSTDEDELATIADRVLVFKNGVVAREMSGNELTAENIVHAVVEADRTI